MVETYQLFAEVKKAGLAKVGADRMAIGEQHFYKLCVDPLTLDVPVRNDVDRISNLLSELAVHPRGKTALVMFKLYFDDLFLRLVEHDTVSPLTCEGMPAKVETLCRSFADVLHECKKDFVPDAIASQASELIADLTTLVRCAEATDDTPVKPSRRTPLIAS